MSEIKSTPGRSGLIFVLNKIKLPQADVVKLADT